VWPRLLYVGLFLMGWGQNPYQEAQALTRAKNWEPPPELGRKSSSPRETLSGGR